MNIKLQAKRFKARAHWGKCGLIYHGREMLDLKLDDGARSKFVGMNFVRLIQFGS